MSATVTGRYGGRPVSVTWYPDGVVEAPDDFLADLTNLFSQHDLDFGPLVFVDTPSWTEESDAAVLVESLFSTITTSDFDVAWGAGGDVRGPDIRKHAGPGPHPGTGSPQSVHGGGSSPRRLAAEVESEGGFTVRWPDRVRPSDGWMVAVEGAEEKVPLRKLTADRISSYLRRHRDLLAEKNTHFGAWLDGNTVFLDVSRRFKDQARAVKFGQDQNQLAIFNLGTFEELRLAVAKAARRRTYVGLSADMTPEEILTEIKRVAVRKHAQHDQRDHGNWARGNVRLKEARSTKSFTEWGTDDFANHDEVRAYIADREATDGGAWSYSTTFGHVSLVRADTPSKIPDEYSSLHGGPQQIYWKGRWQAFSDAARIREQRRGLIQKHAQHDQRDHGNWARRIADLKDEFGDPAANRPLLSDRPRGVITNTHEMLAARVALREGVAAGLVGEDLVDHINRAMAWTADLRPVAKHAQHDQKDHGNWARNGGSSTATLPGPVIIDIKDSFAAGTPSSTVRTLDFFGRSGTARDIAQKAVNRLPNAIGVSVGKERATFVGDVLQVPSTGWQAIVWLPDPAPEQLAADRLSAAREKVGTFGPSVRKHNAPIHPGTGTDQSVHGGGGKSGSPPIVQESALFDARAFGPTVTFQRATLDDWDAANLTTGPVDQSEWDFIKAERDLTEPEKLAIIRGVRRFDTAFPGQLPEGIEVLVYQNLDDSTSAYVSPSAPGRVFVNLGVLERHDILARASLNGSRGVLVGRPSYSNVEDYLEDTVVHEMSHIALFENSPMASGTRGRGVMPDIPHYHVDYLPGDLLWGDAQSIFPSQYAAQNGPEWLAEAMADVERNGDSAKPLSAITVEAWQRIVDTGADARPFDRDLNARWNDVLREAGILPPLPSHQSRIGL